MFTFQHITSIGLTSEEYAKRLAAGEKNLVKGENKWYREVVTEVTVPLTVAELLQITGADAKMKLGDETFTVPYVIKHYIVGLKLAVNQRVQAAERDGGIEWKSICAKILSSSDKQSDDYANALRALVGSAKDGKIFAEKWLESHGSDGE